ncbi:hypothetical protein JCM10213_008125 [Rhodosporidiobolus nylandii]
MQQPLQHQHEQHEQPVQLPSPPSLAAAAPASTHPAHQQQQEQPASQQPQSSTNLSQATAQQPPTPETASSSAGRVRKPSQAMREAEETKAAPRAAFAQRVPQKQKQDRQPSPPQGPPTPAATASPSASSSSIPLPSFLSADPLSSDPDSSSSEDGFGQPKPAKPPRFSKSTGLPRPRPSYYYDASYDPGTAGNKKKGRRGGYKGVPVFEPSMEDFEGNGGFYGYVKRIEKYGLRSGIVKVVPPKEWSAQLPPTLSPLKDIRLREPIEQHMMGSQGLYRCTNVAKTKIWNAAQWKDLADKEKYAPPDPKKDRERGERSERSAVSEKVARRRRGEAGGNGKGKGKEKEREREEAEEEADGADDEDEEDEEEDEDYAGEGTPKKGRRTPAKRTPGKGKAKAVDGEGDIKMEDAPSAAASARSSPAPSVASTSASAPAAAAKKKSSTALQRAEPTPAEWAAFCEKYDELPHGMRREDYTVEMMRDFERRYWRTLTFGESPMYGADMAGSLFSDSTKAWNVAHLGDLLPLLAPGKCSIPGVVSPYLYFGMWRATFAWHVEDADLYSINYIHFGAPKFWYSVPQEQAKKFERVMEGFFPTDFRKCHEFLRHKAFLASPRVLSNSGITLNRCAQLPGEFILTYPKGYHSGFNLGFNCAESINFATERWLELGKKAKHCRCIDDAVNIDVNIWLKEAAKAEALAKGEPWPYDDVPSSDGIDAAPPPVQKKRMAIASGWSAPKKHKPAPRPQQQPAVQQPIILTAEGLSQLSNLLQHHQGVLPPHLKYLEEYIPQLYGIMPAPRPAPPPQQRSSSIPQPNPYARDQFVYQPQSVASKPARPSSQSHSHSPAPAAAAPAPPPPAPKPKKPDFVCALCPDLSEEGLVAVGEPGVRRVPGGPRAHRVCVMFTPATWIELDPQNGEELVRGYGKIEKARWKLKCQLCTEIHGTKIQCTKGKCTKAFHVTCALKDDSGVFMDATIPDEQGEIVSILDAALESSPPPEGENEGPTVGEASKEKTPPPAAAAAPKSPTKGIPNNDLIQLTVLCRTHNPEFQRLEAERKANELKAKIDALGPSARIRVRINGGGVFDVTLDKIDYEKENVSFVFDDGKRNHAKWKALIWPEDPEVARKKLEKQQRAAQAKAAVLDRPKYTNTAKRLSSASSVPAFAAQPQAGPTAAEQAARAAYAQPQVQQAPARTNYYSSPQPAPAPAAASAQPSAYGFPVQRPPPGYGYPNPAPHQQQQQQFAPYPTPQHAPRPPPQPAYGYPPQPQPAYYAAAPVPPAAHYPQPGPPPASAHAPYPSPAATYASPVPQYAHAHPHPHMHPHPQMQGGSPYGSPAMQHPAPPQAHPQMQQQQPQMQPFTGYSSGGPPVQQQ